eukprot:7555575-Alexandrium_andersonii.AAC.1
MLADRYPPQRPPHPLRPLECIDRALCALPPPLEFSRGDLAADVEAAKRAKRLRAAVGVPR